MIPDDEPQNWRDIVRADHIALIEIADESGLHERTIAEALGGYVKTRPETEARIQRAVDVITGVVSVEPERRQGRERRTQPRGADRRERTNGDKVRCPFCNWPASVVLPVHFKWSDAGYQRLRQCAHCKQSFRTIESAAISPPAISSATKRS